MKIDEKVLNVFLMVFLVIGLITAIYLFVSWFESDKKATKATPVIVDNTTQEPYLLDNGNFLAGSTGYDFATLYQPCEVVDPLEVLPNLPLSYTKKICNPDKGLVCTGNVVQGGTICLVDFGKPCYLKTDCVPGSECINRTCQRLGDTINRICINDTSCKGTLDNLNHVCEESNIDFVKRCKYDFYPSDAGCRIKEECLQSDAFNSVICYTESGGIVNLIFTFIGNNKFSFTSGKNDKTLEKGTRIDILEDENLKGTFVISNVELTSFTETKNNYTITIINTSTTFQLNLEYNIVIGDRGDGICLIEYPLGSRPQKIINSDILVPCESNNISNGYCIETLRKNSDNGLEGQVCNKVLTGKFMKCDIGLSCISNKELQDRLFGNRNTENLTTQNLDVGKCVSENNLLNFGDFCDISNSKCNNNFSCLETNNFSYCGFDWDILPSSLLVNCPDGFYRPDGTRNCIPMSNYICLTNCDDSISSSLRFFDKDAKKFELTSLSSIEKINLTPLLPKDFPTSEGISLNYYYKENNDIIIQGETLSTTIQLPNNSNLLDLQVNNDRLNLFYLQEYKNYRKREYELELIDPILTGGVVTILIDNNHSISPEEDIIYFTNDEDANNYILDPKFKYRLIMNGSVPGTLTEINKVNDDGSLTPVTFNEWDDNFSDHYFITYSSVYSFNKNQTSEPITFENNTLINGDKLTLNVEENSGISVGTNTLSNNNILFSISTKDDTIVLTDLLNSVNKTPILNGNNVLNSDSVDVNINGVSGSVNLELEKINGIKLFSLDLSTINTGDVYKIEQEEYYLKENGFLEFNSSFGNFLDLSKENIYINNINNGTDYKSIISNKNHSEIIYGNILNTTSLPSSNSKNVVKYTKNNIVNYCIVSESSLNQFVSPSPKIPFIDYSSNKSFELDKVENLDTIIPGKSSNVFTFNNFKNILNPSSYSIPIAFQSKMRKINFDEISYDNTKLTYQDVNNIDENVNPLLIQGNLYGYCTPIKLDNSIEIITQTNQIIITNQNDIDLFFKYQSDFVIGFNLGENGLPEETFVITKIEEFEDQERIVLETNTIISMNNIDNSYLYVNNIFPISLVSTGDPNTYTVINGGDILLSSCIQSTNSSILSLTNYNKLLINTASSTPSFSDLFYLQTGNIGVYPSIITDFKTLLTISGETKTLRFPVIQGSINYIFVTNNIFWTSVLIKKEQYLNNLIPNRVDFNFLLLKNQNTRSTIKGIDTLPFYTNTNIKNKDESIINNIEWPSWLTSLNVGTLNFYKMIINVIPGNLDSRTIYYCFVETNNTIKLLSLSSNNDKEDIINFDYPLPVPVTGLNQNVIQNISKKFFMTPYDNILYLLSDNQN